MADAGRVGAACGKPDQRYDRGDRDHYQQPLGYLPVGREPHLATVAPRGSEAWAAIRGENYVEVLKLERDDLFDASRLRTERIESVEKIPTVRRPSMVSFSSDGRHAFVAAAKRARVDKIDTATRDVVVRRAVAAPFTPFGLVTPDGGSCI